MSNSENLRCLEVVAAALGPELLRSVVFVGGRVVNLLVTDPSVMHVRPTNDIDLVSAVASRVEWNQLGEQLRQRGFCEDTTPGAPICRWTFTDRTNKQHIVDVMPTNEEILGFANRWLAEARQHAAPYPLSNNTTILVVAAPYLLAAKIEAFRGRGGGDYVMSNDIEDIVTLVDGRPSLADELRASPHELRLFIRQELSTWLSDYDFIDALPGHLPVDQSRQRDLLSRLQGLATNF